ncbi:uncharacterized protein LOC129752232 [Uranotaenia lowii]|uniref:uncharacterized protein LOC129752232 n=1 Tax=Uranotaenia lowii TaxID=190385 RepID=UPI0024786A9E|nr:uncharacterized protein LOC129752232 [Uranotaenia lowii]
MTSSDDRALLEIPKPDTAMEQELKRLFREGLGSPIPKHNNDYLQHGKPVDNIFDKRNERPPLGTIPVRNDNNRQAKKDKKRQYEQEKELIGEAKVVRKMLQTATINLMTRYIEEGNCEENLANLLSDNKIEQLRALINELENWDAVGTIPKTKSFLINSKLQPLLGNMLVKSNEQLHLLKIFFNQFNDAVNEVTENFKRILPDLKAPLHYAVEQNNTALLDFLLEQDHLVVNVRDKLSKTPLFYLCEKYKALFDQKFKTQQQMQKARKLKNQDDKQSLIRANSWNLHTLEHYIEKLLQKKADFNICDTRLVLPYDLLLAVDAEEANEFRSRCIQLHDGPLASVQFKKMSREDRSKQSEKTVRMVTFYPEEEKDNARVSIELLEIYLRFKQLEMFDKNLAKLEMNKEETIRGVISLLLHSAVSQDLGEMVKKIIEHTEDKIFRISRGHSELVVEENLSASKELYYRKEFKGLLRKACDNGNIGMVNLLLKKIKDRELINDDPILVTTITKAQNIRHRPEEHDKLLKCVEALIEKGQKIYITRSDKFGNTALHVAVKYGYTEIALKLLHQKNAYLGMRNELGQTPLHLGGYEFWKKYFDQCLSLDREKSVDRTEVVFDFHGFRINKGFQKPKKMLSDDARNTLQKTVDEIMALSYDDNANRWQHIMNRTNALLNWIKEKRLKGCAKISELVLEATASNVTRIQKNASSTEIEPIMIIAETEELKRLLLHPVVHTFILIKWKRLSASRLINVFFMLLALLCFSAYSLQVCVDESGSVILSVLSFVGIVFLILREVLQVFMLRMKYISWMDLAENMFDVMLIVFMSSVLIRGCNTIFSSLTSIIFAMQLLTLLPFKNSSTYMYMFKIVSINFIKSLLHFTLLLIAFIYSFYLSYNGHGKVEKQQSNKTSVSNESSENAGNNSAEDSSSFNSFPSVLEASLKTLVMTIGEIDASSMKLAPEQMVVLVLFIFFATIVIMNLINGLAVSDIAAIQKESKIVNTMKKVFVLERYEQGIYRTPLRQLLCKAESLKQGTRLKSLVAHVCPDTFFANYKNAIVRPRELGKVLVTLASVPKPEPSTVVQMMDEKKSEPPIERRLKLLSNLPFDWFRTDRNSGVFLNLGFYKFPLFLALDEETLKSIHKICNSRGNSIRDDDS